MEDFCIGTLNNGRSRGFKNIGRLDLDFTTEEHSLADFHVDAVAEIHYFSDFHSYAEQKDVNKVYYDRGIHALYFLHPSIEDGTVAEIFYYK